MSAELLSIAASVALTALADRYIVAQQEQQVLVPVPAENSTLPTQLRRQPAFQLKHIQISKVSSYPAATNTNSFTLTVAGMNSVLKTGFTRVVYKNALDM